MVLSLKSSFCAAHRLMHHKGKCRNLHGHSWVVEVIISGTINAAIGMVIDFAELKKLVGNVLEPLDHSTILNESDELVVLIPSHMQVVKLVGEPTCENLSKWIFRGVWGRLSELKLGCTLFKVRVWESDDVYAEHSGGNE